MAVQKRKERHDPLARHYDGTSRKWELKGTDPAFRYVLVADASVDDYLAADYEICRAGDGGATFKHAGRGFENGAPVARGGHTLMRLPTDVWLEQQAAERAWADAIENKILDKRSAQNDPVRGMHISPQYMRVRSGIKAAETELSAD